MKYLIEQPELNSKIHSGITFTNTFVFSEKQVIENYLPYSDTFLYLPKSIDIS